MTNHLPLALVIALDSAKKGGDMTNHLPLTQARAQRARRQEIPVSRLNGRFVLIR